MGEHLKVLLGAIGGNALVIGQLVFSTAFIASCEIPNLLGRRERDGCLDRWYVVTALWFPNAATTGPVAAADRRRRQWFNAKQEIS